MRLSYNWLQDYVDLEASPTQLADRLTMVGLEVEELYDRYEYLNKVVVARVASVEDHPGSDHLKLCQVETGDHTYQVVCGAPNVRAGMLSAMALPGAELPGGMTVGAAEIRGVKSSGMLCSEAELVVGPDASGVMDLTDRARLGQELKKALGLDDWVFEIGITPNRPDCLSLIGVAREVAGISNQRLKYPEFNITEWHEKIKDVTSIRIEAPEHCPRYVARVIKGVSIGPSPFWMVDRLAAAGVRSINNIVDITNFVLMETGQPLHAFDMNRLEERRIVVRLAEEGERFTTLDNTERILTPEMLMICDGKRSVAVAGVMGGLNSEIEPDTTDVLLESAYFNPVSIRRTSKTLGLSTEASFRFERGSDPELCVYAANRAAELMGRLAGGRVLAGVIDENPIPHKKKSIPFSPSKCNAFLGTNFGQRRMISSLAGIEIAVSGNGEELVAEAPSFRVDLTREVDIFEEVARLLGYYQIQATMPAANDEAQPLSPSWVLRSRTREIMEGLGFSEAVNYSFINQNFCDKLKFPEGDKHRRIVRIINPLSEDQGVMRTTLAPCLIDTLRRNQSYGVTDTAIYEIGMVFFDREGEELPEERLTIGGVWSGARNAQTWYQRPEMVDFYDLKGVVEELLDGVDVESPVFKNETIPPFMNRKQCASICSKGVTLGYIGRLDAGVAKSFDIRGDAGVYLFELDVEKLLTVQKALPTFTPVPRYPYVERDIALVLDRKIEASAVLNYIKNMKEDFLTDVFLFDAYEGKQVEKGRKSLAYRLRYRSNEKTLTDEEVNGIHERVTRKVLDEFSASLRA